MAATALIRNPAGEPDPEPKIKIVLELIPGTGEAMQDPFGPCFPEGPKDREEIRMRIPFMQKKRFSAFVSQSQLLLECRALVFRV